MFHISVTFMLPAGCKELGRTVERQSWWQNRFYWFKCFSMREKLFILVWNTSSSSFLLWWCFLDLVHTVRHIISVVDSGFYIFCMFVHAHVNTSKHCVHNRFLHCEILWWLFLLPPSLLIYFWLVFVSFSFSAWTSIISELIKKMYFVKATTIGVVFLKSSTHLAQQQRHIIWCRSISWAISKNRKLWRECKR